MVRTYLCASALALLLAATHAAAATTVDAEFYVNTYRSIGTIDTTGPRMAAMGGGGRGLADGAHSVGVNPAALGALTGTAAHGGIGFDWLDDGYDDANQTTFRLGGAANLDRFGNSVLGNQAIGGVVQTQKFTGAADMDMKRQQTTVVAGYGLHLMDDLLAGVSVGLFDGKWQTKQQTDDAGANIGTPMDRDFIGGEFKAGGIYRVSSETTIGGTASYSTGNYKDKTSGSKTGDLDRYQLGLGMAYQYCEPTLILGDIWYDYLKTDIPGLAKEKNEAWGLSVGIEQQVIEDTLALRGGLYYDNTDYSASGTVTSEKKSFSEGRFGFTAGFGVKVYSMDLGYSLDVNSSGNVKNFVDLSAEW